MKEQKGLSKRSSILCRILQQLAAFLTVFCVAVLVLHSFIYVKTNSTRYSYYGYLNPFSTEAKFEDTVTFRDMLQNSLREIIRYNVLKSQLETDGVFDGGKIIDVQSFVNRKADSYGVLREGAAAEAGSFGQDAPYFDLVEKTEVRWGSFRAIYAGKSDKVAASYAAVYNGIYSDGRIFILLYFHGRYGL